MHPAIATLLRSLTFGSPTETERDNQAGSAVGKVARVYEIARNAIEFRADHLVRRAAIERILRRQLIFGRDTSEVAEQLVQELKWAMYVTELEEEIVSKAELQKILEKLVNFEHDSKINHDWLVGLVSAEIEEKLNPNSDYHRFTNFAFNELRSRVQLNKVQNPELLLYVTIDKVYSQSDAQQISYHLYKLIRGQVGEGEGSEKIALEETWKHFQEAMYSRDLNRLSAFLRRQMGPLVLLRDMYFMNPTGFSASLEDKNKFAENAREALQAQMQLMSSRIRTATTRSLTYVFLTKMLLALIVEIPVDRLLSGGVNYLIMGMNVVIPVGVMWLMTASIKLPDRMAQEKLLAKSWQIVSNFDEKPHEGEILSDAKEKSTAKFILYYLFYGLLFMAIFTVMIGGLIKFGYSPANIFIFLFFLSIVSFFAFRIRQTAQVYSYSESRGGRTGFMEALMLPIVIVGGWLSSGVAKLNFLVFIFDFVLEAPFKMILRFLDSWLAFLGSKKDEAVG